MTGGVIKRRRMLVVICVILLVAAALLITVYQSAVSRADYNNGYKIGLEAYTYGLPLLVTNTTFETMTSINVSNGAFGPVNQFNNVRSLNNPDSTAVVAPSPTSLSSIAWLDLSKEPQVLHVPEVQDHFFVFSFIDPYTQLKGSYDIANVTRIQDGYTLTPLSQYGTNYQQNNLMNPNATPRTYQIPDGLAFYDMLGQQLALFPPPGADQPELARFAEVGIGPGMEPSHNSHLSKDTLRGLEDAVVAGPAQIRNDTMTLYLESFDQHNGYFLGGFGQYGTNYPLRAVISQVGLGAVTSEQTIYAMSWADPGKNPLNGSTSYVLHMASAPPVNQTWSITAYTLNGTMIPNSINRYEISDASQLAYNANGSVDLYLQSTSPSDPASVNNWLPTAKGQGFEVMWRLDAPETAGIPGILNGTGWQPPAITAVP